MKISARRISYFIIYLVLFSQLIGVVIAEQTHNISLPQLDNAGNHPLVQLFQQRRSVREYKNGKVTLDQIAQLLWAAQGITHPQGFRTAPSAGALYPLELYLVAGHVDGLKTGVFRYQVKTHQLEFLGNKDVRKTLAHAALGQSWIKEAAAVVVFTAEYERTTRKYGKRGVRYVHMEVGHAAQNLFLQAEALGLGTVTVGAFSDDEVTEVLQLPSQFKPLLLMPVGIK